MFEHALLPRDLQRDDIAAVMDAVGIEDAVVFAGARAGSMAMLFAATHPDRTRALILYAPVAKTVATPDSPFGKSADEQAAFFERFVREVGTGRNLELQAPSRAEDERGRGRRSGQARHQVKDATR